jgi:hypothetical protein
MKEVCFYIQHTKTRKITFYESDLAVCSDPHTLRFNVRCFVATFTTFSSIAKPLRL